MNHIESVSFIVPVYNEAAILRSSITRLVQTLRRVGARNIEILLIDNGSTDATPSILDSLSRISVWVKVLWFPYPDFGEAVLKGIRSATKSHVCLVNVDWWDFRFIQRAYHLRSRADIIVGSKRKNPSLDRRPFLRKLGTIALMFATRLFFGYRGTDTHGLKFMRRRAVLPLFNLCITREVLETELLVRAQRNGLRIVELPCPIREIRPARVSFLARGLRVFQELVILSSCFGSAKEDRGSRVFIFEGDDLGYDAASVRATARLWQSGMLSFASLIPNLPGFEKAVWFLKRSTIPVRLHVNLVEGRSVCKPEVIPSLVKVKGEFYSLPLFLIRVLLRRIDPADIEREVIGQLGKIRNRGIRIDGFDSHRHTHMFSPVAEVFTSLSRRYAFSNTRHYGNFRTFTFFGACKKFLVSVFACLTHALYFSQLRLPSSWKNDGSGRILCFRSWESVALWRVKLKNDLNVVIHPGLPYDKG